MYSVLNALWYVEEGFVEKSHFEGMSLRQLREEVAKLGKAFRPKIAATSHRRLAKIAEQKATEAAAPEEQHRYQQQAEAAHKAAEELLAPKPAPVIDINDYAPDLAKRLTEILGDNDQRATQLQEIIKYQEYLEPAIREDLMRTLLLIARRATDYAEALRQVELPARQKLELVASQR